MTRKRPTLQDLDRATIHDWAQEGFKSVGEPIDESPVTYGYTIKELLEKYGPDAVVIPRVIYQKRKEGKEE